MSDVGASGPEGGHAVYRRQDHVLSRHVVGETLLVPVRGKLADLQRLFTLNPVAEFVWERLDGARSVAQIAGEVSDAFDVTREQAEKDIGDFVQRLAEDGLALPAGGVP